MKKIFIDVSEHTGRGLERMICRLEPGFIKPVLIGSVTRKDGGYVEDDRGFFVSERILRSGFVGKSIEPTLISSFGSTTSSQRRREDYQVKEIFM